MFKFSLFFLLVISFNLIDSAKNSGIQTDHEDTYEKHPDARSTENNQSDEQLTVFELDELIKNLEKRINAREITSKEINDNSDVKNDELNNKDINKVDTFENKNTGYHVHPNTKDRKIISAEEEKKETTEQKKSVQTKIQKPLSDSTMRIDKRKISHVIGDLDQLEKEAYNLKIPLGGYSHRDNQLVNFDNDQQYYQALMRLQYLYNLYDKRYQQIKSEDRSSRHCPEHFVSKNMDYIQSRRDRYLEKSRLVADRIAESATKLVTKKGRFLNHLKNKLCGCGCGRSIDSHHGNEEYLKRDVAVSTATASDTVVESKVGNTEVEVASSVDTASSTVAGSGGISSSSDISTDHHVATNIGTSHSGLGISRSGIHNHRMGMGYYPRRGHMTDYYPNEEYENRMIMDMAIDQAADMIRRLAHETRSEIACRNDPNFERNVLGLAIDLVNKVTDGVTGDIQGKFDFLGNSRYKNVEEYLRASMYDDEGGSELLSNSGFDYANYGLGRSRGLLDSYDDYIGHASPFSRGACENCDDPLVGSCLLCKREQPVFKGRTKRSPDINMNDKIHHLEQLEEASRKRSNSGGGVWVDVNKLYNFKDFENNKFIDLSMNCTEDPEKPDCQRLHFDLVVPTDADPVPLWFVRDYLRHGRDLAVDMHDRALGLRTSADLHPAPHSPSMLHFLNNRVTSSIVKLNEESQKVLFGTKVLQEKLMTEYNMPPNKFLEFLRHHDFRVTGSEICRARHKRCNSLAKYRSLEGSCNNFNNPSWGQSNTAFVRILPARYSDGIHALPVSVLGGELPNPRIVSTKLFSRNNATDAIFTLALMQWGQIIAHDFARQVIDQTVDGGIECCDRHGNGPLPKTLQHHSCSPIVIPETDSLYSRYGQTCMNFVRSMTVTKEDCSLGQADQLNGVSSFLDLNPVYGPDRATSESLRELQGGRMRIELRTDRVMMPTASKSDGYCDARTNEDICFDSGDVRTNQNPQLIVLQTLFIREHNRIAYELAAINPHWNDERLFQESRQIVIAEYQHITYNHWLPLVLGRKYCNEHQIIPKNGLSNDYDVRINPSTINSFTSGAFRFLHSLIEGNINLFNDNYSSSSSIRLSDYYFRPQIVEPNNNFESLLRGLVYQTIQKSDANFHEEVTEYLFRSTNKFGMDLEALDIQRSRDHGIPGYNAYREICHLKRAKDFLELINEISLNNIEKLQTVYKHVDDIDLLVGATMENRLPGSLLGPTLQCLIGEQFYRARVGDKYFYNNANFQHSFTPEQFAEVKKASLAGLICDTGDSVYEIQRDAFKISSYSNPVISCFNLPKINLEYWKEQVY